MRIFLLLSLMWLGGITAANAATPGELLAAHLYAGTLKDGDATLGALSSTADAKVAADANAAQGILAFVAGVERLGQALHRHGLETSPGSVMMRLPVLRMPVEPNPNPEPLDYIKYRAILQNLFDDMTKADALLAKGEQGEGKFPLDLTKVRIDINGDSKAGDNESLGFILAKLNGDAAPAPAADLNFAFDKADILWLRGYIQFITASVQFGLSVDFETSFNKTAHVYFPRAGLPMADELLAPAQTLGFVDNSIGDSIAMVHLLNWKVIDSDRLKDVRVRLLNLAKLSHESWASVRAETDNDREWLPNAKQTGKWRDMPVENATIDGWLGVIDEFAAILDGKKLLAHWRFNKGFNVKRFFEESKQVDMVLIIAGVDAVPFLEDGPISTSADWEGLTSLFRSNFLGYAIWFN